MAEQIISPSSLVTNGAIVGTENALPVVVVSGVAPTGADVTLSPRNFIVNGEVVSLTNPLPIYLAIDGDVQAWVAAVVANGGTVSDARQQIVSTFVTAEKASGAWNLTDDYWPLWGESDAQALVSLKQRRVVTAVAAPTFTIDRGYAFNGTTQYLNTGFVPSVNFAAMTGSSLRLAVYERTNVAANTNAAGVLDTSGTRNLVVSPLRASGGAFLATLNCSNLNMTTGLVDSRGYSVANRSGGPVFTGYKNGAAFAPVVPATNGTALPTRAIYIGCYNNGGTAAGFRASSIGFVAAGASLSAAQELAQYNAVQAWATAIGAQV